MKTLFAILIAAISLNAFAADLNQEMDSLGANKALLKRAQAIDPENRIRVVQNREVKRTYRLEVGVDFGAYAAGGDSYMNTTLLGGQLDFHLSPHWSVGARYASYSNNLTAEGRSVFSDANSNPNVRVPSIAFAKDSYMGVVNFYPIYGKLNLFDASIAQFDLYLLGGAGQMNYQNRFDSRSSPMFTAGAGIGVWISQHISTRLEARWQGYTERVYDGADLVARNMNETVLTAAIGFIL